MFGRSSYSSIQLGGEGSFRSVRGKMIERELLHRAPAVPCYFGSIRKAEMDSTEVAAGQQHVLVVVARVQWSSVTHVCLFGYCRRVVSGTGEHRVQ